MDNGSKQHVWREPHFVGTSDDLPGAAALLAEAGIPIFPCIPNGKRPLTAHGFLDATNDIDQVDQWWARTPAANIGIPTGRASGVVVVDVDVHASGNGFADFERSRSSGIADGWAWLARTPSGGLHAYFHPASRGSQRSWQAPKAHIDFRGEGGYIVAPPSRIDSAAYRIIAVAQHAPRTLDGDALRRFLDPPLPRHARDSLPLRAAAPDHLAVWVAARPEGARNHGLFWAACRMAEAEHPFTETLSILGSAAQSAGLAEQEATTTIRSAYRAAYGRSEPTAPQSPRQGVQL